MGQVWVWGNNKSFLAHSVTQVPPQVAVLGCGAATVLGTVHSPSVSCRFSWPPPGLGQNVQG